MITRGPQLSLQLASQYFLSFTSLCNLSCISFKALESLLIPSISTATAEKEQPITTLMGYLSLVQTHIDVFLSFTVEYFRDRHKAVQEAMNLVLRRKAIGVEALAVQRNLIIGEKYPALKEKLNELNRLRMEIAKRTLAGTDTLSPSSSLRQLLDELNNRKEGLEAELANHIPEMRLEQKFQSISLKDIANALPQGADFN